MRGTGGEKWEKNQSCSNYGMADFGWRAAGVQRFSHRKGESRQFWSYSVADVGVIRHLLGSPLYSVVTGSVASVNAI